MPKQKPKGRNASCEATMIDTNDDNGKYTYYKGMQSYRRADACPLHTWLDACVYTQIRKLRLSTSLDSQEKYCNSLTCAKVHSGPSQSRMELPEIITHTWHWGSKVLRWKWKKRRIWKSLKPGENRWNPLKPGENPLKPGENRWKRFWHPKPKSLRDFPCAKKLPILKSVKSTRWLENDTHCPSWLHQLHPENDKNRLLIWHFRKFRPLLFKSSPKMWKTLRRVAENQSRKQDRSPRIQMATIGQELTLIRRQSRHRPRVFLQHGLS